jgi:hypothetical protein
MFYNISEELGRMSSPKDKMPGKKPDPVKTVSTAPKTQHDAAKKVLKNMKS